MSLAKRSSLRRVAVVAESQDPYVQSLARGISGYSQEHGNWTTQLVSHTSEPLLLGWLRDWNADGVLLAKIPNRRVVKAIAKTSVPAVDACRLSTDLGLPTVAPDAVAIAELAARHFLDRAIRHFGLVAPNRGAHRSVDAQMQAFRGIVRSADCSCDAFHFGHQGIADDGPGAEQDGLARWIEKLPKPVGIMACDDYQANRALDACRRIGAAVPGDVAIVGIGNDECLCELSSPSLSSVDVNPQQIGYEAAGLLDRLMAGNPSTRPDIVVEPRGVVARESSDVLATDDPKVIQAIRFIREHACDRIHVTDVTSHVKMSKTALEPRLKQVLGRTIHQEIRRVQIERVKQLLLTTDVPLKQIAAQTGFYYVEYMMRVFRLATGQTMREYREGRRKEV